MREQKERTITENSVVHSLHWLQREECWCSFARNVSFFNGMMTTHAKTNNEGIQPRGVSHRFSYLPLLLLLKVESHEMLISYTYQSFAGERDEMRSRDWVKSELTEEGNGVKGN